MRSARSGSSTSTVWKTTPSETPSGSRPASVAPARTASIAASRFAGAVPTRMKTPSATRPAARSMRGPPAAIQTGTGRACGSRAGSRAPVSTASPCSRARARRVASSSSRTRAGRSPARRTAVSPIPSPSSVRPSASSSTVAIEEAVTLMWRLTGLAISGPMRIRLVARAASASIT